METLKTAMPAKETVKTLNVKALKEVGARFSEINKHIEAGKPIPEELNKSFVTFPLSDDPYSEIE